MVRHRIQALGHLGDRIGELSDAEFQALAFRVENNNSWFTPKMLRTALDGLMRMLDRQALEEWVAPYSFPEKGRKDVGILAAGNIPAVAFHDLLCVLMAGHKASVKLSSGDQVLMRWLIAELQAINPVFEADIEVADMLKAKDAYIATGSNNSARYFQHYFGRYPHIIRQNRTSVAVLRGEETEEELRQLGADVFTYYGLGCRNVSKVYIRKEEHLHAFFDAVADFEWVREHHKYVNNYDYNKSIFLVNKVPHLDTGFLLAREEEALVSPIAVLHYAFYEQEESLKRELAARASEIQCLVAGQPALVDAATPLGQVAFGQAQVPGLADYADHVDTLTFCTSL
ncbi:MAG: acyl-CoA reductase [Nitritalea sp.]